MPRKNTFSLVVILLLSFLFSELKAQDTLNSYVVDKKSYELYEQKNWKELISFTNKAFKKDYDYYYLRMRAGIANYELGNYIDAQKHFEKALAFNSGDELVLEYLYYCRVFSYRPEEARWFGSQLPEQLRKKVKADSVSPIAFIIVEGGVKTTDSSRILGNGNYFHLGLNHYVAKRFSMYHAITYFGQSFSDGNKLTGQFTQFQYYLSATVPLKKNWQLAPALQLFNKGVIFHIPAVPAPMPFPPPPPNVPPPKGIPARDSVSKNNYYVASISLKKTIEKFDVGVNTTISSVFGNDQYQHGLFVSYAPVRDKKLVFGCNAYMHTENYYATNYFAVIPFVYVNPIKRLSLTVSYLNNNGGKNAVESNGYIVNNSTDLTTSRFSGIASVNLSKQIDIYGLYQFENKEHNKTTNAAGYVYHYNLFVLGIKIRPKA